MAGPMIPGDPTSDGCADVFVSVLGPCVVRAGSGADTPVELSALQRRVICILALAKPESVDADRLIAAAWFDNPPATARTALQNQISRIRARIGTAAVTTIGGSYVLNVATDIDHVVHAVADAEAALRSGAPQDAIAGCDDALSCWRGLAVVDLGDAPLALRHRRRLDEVRRSLENLRLRAAIELGREAWAVPEAERLCADTPVDEERWVLLMRALELAGRRGDALGAFDRARRTLADQLGLDPSQRLRAAEAAIHGHDAPTATTPPSPLVGREELVAEIGARVNAGHSVIVHGETGVGKTRLLAAIASRARRDGALVARSNSPLYPATAISTLADLAEELGVAIDSSVQPVSAFVALLQAQTARVVLVVDDIDRIGPTSAAALQAATSLSHVTLVASATSPEIVAVELHDHTAAEATADALVAIQPLMEPDIRELTEHILRRALTAADPSPGWLNTMCGGNPMLLEHLLEAPATLSRWKVDGVADDTLIPTDAMRELVRNRVSRIGATSRTALRAAAVCGDHCPLDVLSQLAPPRGIAGAVAAGLLVDEADSNGRRFVSFRHGAVRRVVYDDLSPGRRMEIHHRAATLLQSAGATPASIAVHAVAAAEVDPAAAATAATNAAFAASSTAAHADAAQWHQYAVEAAALALNEQVLVTAMIRRGDALRLAGDERQEFELFAAADAAIAHGDSALIGEAAFAILQLGVTTESGVVHQRAIELADLALDVVDDPDLRARIAAAASLTHSMTGSPDLCRRLFDEAERIAVASETRCAVLPFAYLAIGHPAELPRRERLTLELIELARAEDDPVALFEGLQLAFSVAIQRGDGTMLRASVAEAETLMDRVGDVGRQWSLAYQHAALAHIDGDLAAAERHAEHALGLFSPVSPSRAFAVYGAQLLALRMSQHRLHELTPVIRDLVAGQPGVPAWNAALALSLVETDPSEAATYVAAALEHVTDDFAWLAGHVIGGRAAAQLDDAPTRQRYWHRLIDHSGLICWQGTCAYGPVDTVLAMLASADGEIEAAETHVKIARQLATSLRSPLFIAELDHL